MSTLAAHQSYSARPLKVVEPSRGWGRLNLTDIWEYRDLLVSLAKRDVKLRSRQTALGVAWVLLQPLLAALAFTFVFGVVARMSSGGMPLLLITYAGLLGWNLFSGVVSRSNGCLLTNSQLISKVYFPRIVLPLSTVASVLLDFVVAAALLVLLMLYYRVRPGMGLLVMPVCIVAMVMLALGIGACAAAMSVTYRDVQYILPFVTQILLFASPVGYLSEHVPQRFFFAYHLNPMAPLIEAFRWSALGTNEMHWRFFAYAIAVSVLIFISGLIAFKRMERRFADVI